MESTEFINMRKQLGFTQKQLAQLLMASLKAVRSYEQGWRVIPRNIERQLMLLNSMKHASGKAGRLCWNVKECPVEQRDRCPAWQLKAGNFCWFINGTICEGEIHDNWEDKIKVCRKCPMFQSKMPAPGGWASRPNNGI
jgi:DNA-binding XRE family transcriptional regulator